MVFLREPKGSDSDMHGHESGSGQNFCFHVPRATFLAWPELHTELGIKIIAQFFHHFCANPIWYERNSKTKLKL